VWCLTDRIFGWKFGDLTLIVSVMSFSSRGGGYLTKIDTRRVRPEVQPLPFYVPFLTEKVPPFVYLPLKMDIPSREHCIPFLTLGMQLMNDIRGEQYYRKSC